MSADLFEKSSDKEKNSITAIFNRIVSFLLFQCTRTIYNIFPYYPKCIDIKSKLGEFKLDIAVVCCTTGVNRT